MNEALKKLLKALSNPEEELDVIKSRQLMDLKKLDPFKRFYRTGSHPDLFSQPGEL